MDMIDWETWDAALAIPLLNAANDNGVYPPKKTTPSVCKVNRPGPAEGLGE